MYQLLMNGLAVGGRSADLLIDHGPAALRPWRDVDEYGRERGGTYVSLPLLNHLGQPVRGGDGAVAYENRLLANATGTLRQEDWLKIDEDVRYVERAELTLWNYLRARVPMDIPDGFSWSAIQTAVASGDATAEIAFDPIAKADRSRPTLTTENIPLPVIFSDNSFTAREIAISRKSGLPLDTRSMQNGARAVTEKLENLALGTSSYSYSTATGTVYGLRNHPARATKTLTTPTGTNGATTVAELLDMMKTLRDRRYRGPYVAFYSPAWQPYFGLDYTTTYPKSFMTRLMELSPTDGTGISDWVSLDYLTGYQIILVQMSTRTLRAIQGMPLTTLQWDVEGGLGWNMKIMTIGVLQIFTDASGYTGINHGSV